LKYNIVAKDLVMIEKPTMNVQDLEGNNRKIMLFLVRKFSKGLYKHLGADKAEETLIELINNGKLKIAYEEDSQLFSLMVYNEQNDEYE